MCYAFSFYAQQKGAYCWRLPGKGEALDCFPKENHGFPKGNNQARSACMLLKSCKDFNKSNGASKATLTVRAFLLRINQNQKADRAVCAFWLRIEPSYPARILISQKAHTRTNKIKYTSLF